MLSALDKLLLEKVAGLHEIPQGAYNIRKDGRGITKNSSSNIEIATKSDKPGIDVYVKPGTRNESVHIPVILTSGNITDKVYNTFEIGEGSDVLVVAGCGIHNTGGQDSRHDGIHEFRVGKNAVMKYVEKHYAQGEGSGRKVLNPVSIIRLEEGASVQLELIQIAGVDTTDRHTEIILGKGCRLGVEERMLTEGSQSARSEIKVILEGENSSAGIKSRSVARGRSEQEFGFDLVGLNRCSGHIQCDAIIMGKAGVRSIPRITARHSDANLIHEAAIGKIQSEQMTKLMSLGLSEKEAEETILAGFLK